MSVKVKGLTEIQKNIDRAEAAMRRALGGAIYQEGLAIQRVSVKQCPWEFSNLRRSAYTAPPVDGQQGPKVELGYGTEYAVFVHERTELKHKPGTKAKYLEDPIKEASNGYAGRVAVRARKLFLAKAGFGSKRG